ncbi:TUP1-like enhancer of split-domain-containing protein [Phascolomyces articulosus]|uniref:TUP1-like enhancer of split-domain-containing protein n=1 Tax=Phascolomyces articulosus TaxID=60185 RepID=A0AAD5PMC9_9FUNG|nr:TUP1-like enhancer of split-domain-containing protein [Phascolomyces articulosus]
MDEILLNCASDDEIVEELTKYGYKGTNGMTGNNGVYPESIGQLEREEQNATASRNQRIQDLMGPSSATTTNTITQLPILLTSNTDDHQSNEANEGLNTFTTLSKNNIQSQPANSDITSASSSKSDTIVQQTVTIGKDGKRRIKPVTIRTKSSVASRSNSVSQGSSQPRTLLQDDNRPTAMIMSGNDATIIYDFPSAIIPNTGIRATAVGTKRPSGSETAMDVDEIERHRKRPIWMDSAMLPPASSKSKIRLGVPKVKSTFIRPVRDEATKAVMECDNPARADVSDDESDNEQQCARLTVTSKGQTLWQDYLPSAIMLMTGNGRFSAVACEDASIHVYSTAGRRLLPPIVLESTAVLLHCSDQWLLCLTCTGLLYTWDIVNTSSCIDGVSIAPVLNVARLPESTDDDDQDETHDAPSIKDVRIQKNGIPLLITNYRQAFAFHLGMKVWMRISDAWYIISEFWNTGMGTPKDYPLGWLSTAMTLNTGLDPIGQTMLTLVEGRKEATNAITLSHLEIQIAVAALLESPVEYRDWLKQYARRLARENELEKIKELCRWLAGPPFM